MMGILNLEPLLPEEREHLSFNIAPKVVDQSHRFSTMDDPDEGQAAEDLALLISADSGTKLYITGMIQPIRRQPIVPTDGSALLRIGNRILQGSHGELIPPKKHEDAVQEERARFVSQLELRQRVKAPMAHARLQEWLSE